MSILATFKEIKGDSFKEATRAAIDMSTVMGTDLKGSMIQLGKALNDPTKGMSALSRVGVSFTAEQIEQIKTLQESGDMMGAQAVILAELRSEFGGTAAAMRGNFKGSVTASSNALGDLKEEIGFAITKNAFFIEAAKLSEQAFINLTGKVKDNEQSLRDLAKRGATAIITGLGGAVEVVRFFYNGWQGLKLAARGAVFVVIKGAELMTKVLRKVLFPLDLLLSGLAKIGLIESNPLKGFQDTLKGFGDFSAGEFTKLYNQVEAGNKKFDSVKGKIAAIKAELNALPTGKVDIAEDVAKQTNNKTSGKRDVSPHQYKKAGGGLQLINGQWQTGGPVQNTVKNFRSPVQPGKESEPANGTMSLGAIDKVIELRFPGGSFQTDEKTADAFMGVVKKAGMSA